LFEDVDLPKDMAVLVIIPEQEEADIDEIEWLRAAVANTALTQLGYGTLTAPCVHEFYLCQDSVSSISLTSLKRRFLR